MGCTQSKIENEEAVMRCKDRKQFMKEALVARNAFAAAHSAYAMSLKNTGAALSDYAYGEVQNPQLVTSASHESSATSAEGAVAAQPPFDPVLPPPPPPSLTPFSTPIQRATSMPEMQLPKTREQGNRVGPTIVEENDGDDEEDEVESNEKLVMRKRSSGRHKSGDHQKEALVPERAPPPAVENSGSLNDWDYWKLLMDSIPGPSLEVKEEEKVNVERKVFDVFSKREEHVEEKPKVVPRPPPPEVENVVEEEKVLVAAAAHGGGSVGRSVQRGKLTGMGKKRVVKGSMNLLQVFVDLDDRFLKASESAHDVSKMLEATRLHYHSNFADNRGNCLVWIEI